MGFIDLYIANTVNVHPNFKSPVTIFYYKNVGMTTIVIGFIRSVVRKVTIMT